MQFPKIIREGCAVVKPTTCPAPPSIDPRCEDPYFRSKNPGICKGFTRLIAKPDNVILCNLQSTKFKAFLVTEGGQEVELTTGVAWRSSDLAVVQISGTNGQAFGAGMGICTVSASWEDLDATAHVTVLPECCADRTTGIILVIDNSQSMTQQYSGLQGSKLSYAKKLAHDFAGNLNLGKDLVSVAGFNSGGFIVQDFTNDLSLIQDAISTISTSEETTDIADALGDAIGALDSRADIDTKVVILLTDGFQTGGSAGYQAAITVAEEFKSRSGFIVAVGVRTWGDGFDLLELVSSAGFFLSSHQQTEPLIPNWLSGLSGYFCSGDCVPPGDVVLAGHGKLNYDNFTNWNVVGPHERVDLIGSDPAHPEYDLFDMLPGNGLYVDLRGSPGTGGLRTKVPFSFVAGNSYSVLLRLAGNQRKPDQTDDVKVRIIRQSTGDQEFEDTVGPLAAYVDFATYEVTYVAAATFTGFVEVAQEVDLNSWWDTGALLDRVTINEEWLTTDGHVSTLLDDTFDTENGGLLPPECPNLIVSPTSVSPTAGAGYAYDCPGFGCLLEPIPAQVPDPAPLPSVIEAEEGGGSGGGQEDVTAFNPAGVFITAKAVYALLASMQAQIDVQLNTYLPLAGGTLTGAVDMQNNTLSFGGNDGTVAVYQGAIYLRHPTEVTWHRLRPVVFEGSILLDLDQTGIAIDFSGIPSGGGSGGGDNEGPFLPTSGGTMEGGIEMNGYKFSFGGGSFLVYNGNPYLKTGGSYFRVSLVEFEGVMLLDVAQTPTVIP